MRVVRERVARGRWRRWRWRRRRRRRRRRWRRRRWRWRRRRWRRRRWRWRRAHAAGDIRHEVRDVDRTEAGGVIPARRGGFATVVARRHVVEVGRIVRRGIL